LLNSIFAPSLLAIFYFIIILPIGIFIRLSGKDLLKQKIDVNVKSYWIERTKPMGLMKNQF